jgi:hypothetical protein
LKSSGPRTRVPGPRQAVCHQAIKVPIAALRHPAIFGMSIQVRAFFDAT